MQIVCILGAFPTHASSLKQIMFSVVLCAMHESNNNFKLVIVAIVIKLENTAYIDFD